jgi:hypothetical protein
LNLAFQLAEHFKMTQSSEPGPNGSSSLTPNPQSDVRLYGNRATYTFPAALSIIRESPICHVAFVHPGDTGGQGKREETVMNLPLITVVLPDPELDEADVEEDDETHHVVYLHSCVPSLPT